MSAQSHIEKALRDIHMMLSQCQVYDKENNLVIMDKKALVEALQDLSQGIYESMEEHEMTKRSRDQAERDTKRRGDEIIADAKSKAEDVYAGSVLYTDEALKRVQLIMQDAMDSVQGVYNKMQMDMTREMQRVRSDQTGLTGYLRDLADTDKYMQIIDERNKKLAKERAEGKDEIPEPTIAAPKPEIRINEAYFREHGFSLDDEPVEMPEEKMEKVNAEISVNLDSEYFKWKEREANGDSDEEESKKPGKKSLFGRLGK